MNLFVEREIPIETDVSVSKIRIPAITVQLAWSMAPGLNGISVKHQKQFSGT